jgi:hypothetical protein
MEADRLAPTAGRITNTFVVIPAFSNLHVRSSVNSSADGEIQYNRHDTANSSKYILEPGEARSYGAEASVYESVKLVAPANCTIDYDYLT